MKIKLLILSLTLLFGIKSFAAPPDLLESNTSLINLEQTSTEKDFSISPNPSNSKMNLRLTTLEEKTILTVFDVLGKKIYSKELDQLVTTLDVSRWNNGVYLVRVTTDKETQTKRFVKQ